MIRFKVIACVDCISCNDELLELFTEKKKAGSMIQESCVPLHRPEESTPRKKRIYVYSAAYVAGADHYHYCSADHRKKLKPGEPLTLRRQPDNKHDSNAIALYTEDGNMIGYVPRGVNMIAARLMDIGITIEACITAVRPEIESWRQIEIRLFKTV